MKIHVGCLICFIRRYIPHAGWYVIISEGGSCVVSCISTNNTCMGSYKDMNLQIIHSSYFEYNTEYRWENHSLIPVTVVWWEDRAFPLELLIHQIYEDGIRGKTYSELWRSI